MRPGRTVAAGLFLVLGLFPGLLRRAQAQATLDEAMAPIREKAKLAYLGPSPIREAVANEELLKLSSPQLQCDLEPGKRRDKIESFVTAMDGIERLQSATSERPLAPAEKTRLVRLIMAELKLDGSEQSKAIGLYRPGQALPGPLAAAAGAPAAPQVERGRIAQAGAAISRTGLSKDVFGYSGDPGAIGAAAAAPAAGTLMAGPSRAERMSAPAAQPGPQRAPTAVPPPSTYSAALTAAQVERAAADRRVDEDFKAAFAPEKVDRYKVEYWQKAAADADIRPGEGAVGYVARRTANTVMGYLAAPVQAIEDGIGEVREKTAEYAYKSASSESSGRSVRAAFGEAALAAGAFAVTAIPVGRGAKVAKEAAGEVAGRVAAPRTASISADEAINASIQFAEAAPKAAKPAVADARFEAAMQSRAQVTGDEAKKIYARTANKDQRELYAFDTESGLVERYGSSATEQILPRQTGPTCVFGAVCNGMQAEMRSGAIKPMEIVELIRKENPAYSHGMQSSNIDNAAVGRIFSGAAERSGRTPVVLEPSQILSHLKDTGQPIVVTVHTGKGGHAVVISEAVVRGNGVVLFKTLDTNIGRLDKGKAVENAFGVISGEDLAKIIRGNAYSSR